MLVLLPDVSPIVQCYSYFLMLVLLSFINVSHNSFLAFSSVTLVLCYKQTDSLHRLTKTMQPFEIRWTKRYLISYKTSKVLRIHFHAIFKCKNMNKKSFFFLCGFSCCFYPCRESSFLCTGWILQWEIGNNQSYQELHSSQVASGFG